MKLSISERYILLDLLPKEGTYTTLKILRKLREALSFSEEELQKWGIQEVPQANGGVAVQWNRSAEDSAEISIGEKASDIIVASLTRMDQESKLTDREYSLYEKFVEGKED